MDRYHLHSGNPDDIFVACAFDLLLSNAQLDPCDRRIIRLNNFIQLFACVCLVVSVVSDIFILIVEGNKAVYFQPLSTLQFFPPIRPCAENCSLASEAFYLSTQGLVEC